MRIGAYRRKIN